MDIPILLVIAALVGATLNIIRGWSANGEQKLDVKKLSGGIIASVTAALAAVVVFDVSALGGPVQTFLLGLLVGFAADFTTSKLKK